VDVVALLEGGARGAGRRPLPLAWRSDRRLAWLSTIDELISAVRDLGDESDCVLGALMERGPADPCAPIVILAALLRLGLARCHGDRERVDAFAGELAVVLGEAWAGELSPSHRRLGSVIVDRAWGRVRAAERKGRWLRTVDLDAVTERVADQVLAPEEGVVTQVTVEAFRRSLMANSNDGVSAMVLRAWDTATGLVDQVDRSQRDRNRWRYARWYCVAESHRTWSCWPTWCEDGM
jgi:hypothetical protein